MNITIRLSAILIVISFIESIDSANNNGIIDANKTVIDSNGLRFQRILHRKKRFLLFPPGAAIVTTLSFTKTLVPRSPSGINMIGECDIFYPLQTKIADWYPMRKPLPPPPPPPPPPPEDDDDGKQGVLPANVGPIPPNNAHIPFEDQANVIQAAQPAQPDDDAAPFLPTPANIPNNGNRLPTDQEIGIQPGSTLVSDPNFNVGSHPGEVYVDNDKKSEKNPPRRYFNDYSKQTSYHPYYKPQQQYPYYSSRNSTGNYKTYNELRNYNNHRYNSYNGKNAWNPIHKNVHTMQSENNIYAESKDNSHRRFDYKNARRQYSGHRDSIPHESITSNNRFHYENAYSRGSRERRDIFDQLESFMSFKQFDTKSCILRMICEARHYLLPPGKSLFQDIFRILFTLPAENDPEDEYNRAAKATDDECETIYSKQCRFSIIGFLMSKDRPIL